MHSEGHTFHVMILVGFSYKKAQAHKVFRMGHLGSRRVRSAWRSFCLLAECHFVNLGWDSRRPGAQLVRTPLPLRLIPLLCYPTPSPCYPTPLPCSLTPSLCSPTPLPCSPTPLPCSLSGRVTHFINSIAHHRHVLLGGACCFEVRIDPYLITLLCSLTQLLLCLTITACGRLPPLLSSFTRPSSYSRLLAACMSFVACFICQGRQETLCQTASR